MKFRAALIGFTAFLAAAVAVTVLVYGSLRRDVTGPTASYSALFTDVTGLREGDDVRVAGVRVGRVDSVALVGALAKVGFRIQSDQVVYGNTTASVTYQNIIGQRYLGLARGPVGDPVRRLPPGSQLPLERTEPSFDVGALLSGFEPLFTVLDPKQVDRLSAVAIEAFQGDSGAIATLVARTAELTDAFAGRDQILGELIGNLAKATDNLARQDANLDGVIGNARQVVAELDSRRQSLVSSAGSLAHLAGRVATISDTVYPQLTDLLHREPGVAKHVAGMPDQLAFVGSNLPLLLKGLARVSQDGSYGNAYACSANIMGFFPGLNDLVPAIVRLAAPGNVVTNSQKCRAAE